MQSIISGFLVSISLIAAIGAQNAMVLRHGIARSHVAAVAVFCVVSDALLMSLGTAGFGAALQANPRILTAVTLLGIAFLVAYGLMSLRSARRSAQLTKPRRPARVAGSSGIGGAPADDGVHPSPESTDDQALHATGTVAKTLTGAIAGIAAVTWLNPHAYLDTVVLIGSVAASYGEQRWWFTAGAILASAVWFGTLAAGARAFSRQLARPAAWTIIDAITGLVMIGIAIKLALGLA